MEGREEEASNPVVPEGFRESARHGVRRRLPLVIYAGMLFHVLLLPVDAFRNADGWMPILSIRTAAIVGLAAILARLRSSVGARPHEPHVLAALTIGILSIGGLGIVPFSDGDPIYVVQAVTVVYFVTGVLLLLPVKGSRAALWGLIPLAGLVLVLADQALFEASPLVVFGIFALGLSILVAENGWRTQLAAWESHAVEDSLRRAKSDFAAMLTHDIKSPLMVIGGYVDMYRETESVSPQGREFLTGIEAAARRALLLTANFLEISRIESDLLSVQPRNVDLAELVQRGLSDLQPLADLKGVSLRGHCENGIPSVSADPGLVERVLSNLVTNAIRYATDGGRVQVGVRGIGDGEIELFVEDDGAGIPPEAIPKLFTRFQRGEVLTNSTGLGLFIVKSVAEAHGGRVSAENREEGGARFSVVLPVGSPDIAENVESP